MAGSFAPKCNAIDEPAAPESNMQALTYLWSETELESSVSIINAYGQSTTRNALQWRIQGRLSDPQDLS